MASKTIKVTVTCDVIAFEVARFGLLEIIRQSKEDPYGFSGEDAANIAAEAMAAVEKLEGKGGDRGA